MGTEIREIALEENDELSREVVANFRILLQGQTSLLIRVCLKLTDSHLTSKFIIHYIPEEHSLSHAPILYYMPILFITNLTTSCYGSNLYLHTHSVAKPFIV